MTVMPQEAITMPGKEPCTETLTEIAEASYEEGAEMLDRAARDKLHISGTEFLRRWDEGHYAGSDEPAVVDVAMLIPFAR